MGGASWTPGLPSTSVAEPSSRLTCWLLVVQFWAWVRSVKKRVLSHHVLQGWPCEQAGALWVGARTSVCLNSQDSEFTNKEEEEKGHLEQSHIRLGEDLGRLKVSPRSAPVQLHYSLTRQVQALSS